MQRNSFSLRIRSFIAAEVKQAERESEGRRFDTAFTHLERAHVLGQSITTEHTRVHWLMLKLGFKTGNWREVVGQIVRIIGAATKTPFGIYPTGNTGGASVSPFKRMPIPGTFKRSLPTQRPNDRICRIMSAFE